MSGPAGAGPGVVEVVGLHGGQPWGLGVAALAAAEVVVGSPRHLQATAAARPAECQVVALGADVGAAVDAAGAAAAAGRRVCLLASGDPGFFGVARLAGQRLGADRLAVHPAPSSVALAFGRLGLPWDDAAVVSAHGRSLADAVAAVVASPAPAAAVLTAPATPPESVAAALLDAGEPDGPAAVCTRLGEAGEAVCTTTLAGVAARAFDPMSVLVLTARAPARRPAVLAWGLPESDFEHRDGMITKAEVRAVALGKLALPPGGVLWDVGAGSGSVAVECARLAPALRVVAVERDGDQAERVRSNARRHGVAVEVVHGAAPGALAALPDPDRVFVGGGGPDVLDAAVARLRPGGVAVATSAVLEHALAACARLGEMVEVSVARAVPTGALGLRLRAANPVFVAWGPGGR